jgi:predicted GNAT superfamily acetyltransferase
VITVRPLRAHAEFVETRALEKTIWGYADSEAMPVAWYAITTKAGGQAFGAYDGARMVGFCSAMAGIKPDGMPYLHSHTLGVLPGYRDSSLGRRLKLAQRDDALGRGIQLMEWTFDPLELKNAYFNLHRLGAIARRYAENVYGVTGSPLHGAIPTDRLIAEWWLASPRVERALAGKAPAVVAAERIAFPSGIERIRREDPARARELQRQNGDRFRDAFARGLAATGFERAAGECGYLLEPWK